MTHRKNWGLDRQGGFLLAAGGGLKGPRSPAPPPRWHPTYLQACSPGSRSALAQLSQQQLRGSPRPRRLGTKADGVRTPTGGGQGGGERRPFRGNKGFSRSLLLATVPLKEREIDFLDSSSAGVCSRGAGLASWAGGGATCDDHRRGYKSGS